MKEIEERNLVQPDDASRLQRALLECSQMAVVTTDHDGIIQTINAAAEHLFGVKAEEVVGLRSPSEFLSPGQILERAAEFEKAHGRPPSGAPDWELFVPSSPASTSHDWTFVRPDGSSRTASIAFVHLRDDEGRPVGLLAMGQDVTVRATADEKSRDLFESLATHSPVSVFQFDRQKGARFFNSRIGILVGFPHAELEGFGWIEHVHPEDRPRLGGEWNRVFDDNGTVHFEVRFCRPDGSIRWGIVRVAPLRTVGGITQTAVGTIADVTERHRMETAMRIVAVELSMVAGPDAFRRDAVLRLAALLEVEIAFIALATDESATRVRTAAVAIDGVIAENFEYVLAGTPCAETFELSSRVVPYELRKVFPADDKAAQLGAESYVGVCLRDSAGSAMGILVVVSRRPLLRAAEGLAIVRLFAARVATELENERNERSFRDLFEFAPDALLMSEADGRVVLANFSAGTLFGYDPGEMTGLTIERLIPPDVRGRHEAWRAGYLLAPNRRRMGAGGETFFALRKDGTTFPADISLSPITTPLGVVVAAAVRDATERLRAEAESRDFAAELERQVAQRTDQLRAANQELDAFSAAVSHDLRAPLRRIQGFASLLDDSLRSRLSEEESGWFRVISKSSLEMAALIRDLLTAARAARAEIRERRLDLSTMARDAMGAMSADWGDRRIAFEVQEIPAVLGDLVLVEQVLVNLLSNAVKYTRPREDAQVVVGTAGNEAARIVIFVRDNGVGLDLGRAGKLFEIFQRMHDAEEFEGTGVGLATVKRIIERHGGRVWVESSPGKGATFFFTLTAAPAE